MLSKVKGRNHRSVARTGFAHLRGEDRRAESWSGVLLAGMVAEARIFGPAKERVLTIPGEAIMRDPQGAPNVYVYSPGPQTRLRKTHRSRVRRLAMKSRSAPV
jgi:multidrug efflux pump subunit AcrA (membrane-fusion protein)